MRHAKSDRSSGAGSDFDRPLNPRGIETAGKMGKWLKRERLLPDRIVSSPAQRARQTTGLVCKHLKFEMNDVNLDKRIYEADLEDLISVIDDHARGAGCLLLVGHNPGLDKLVGYLAREEPPCDDEGKLMATAAVAVLDFGRRVISSRAKSATLKRLARPGEL